MYEHSSMYKHSCHKAGAMGCGFRATASSEDELRSKLTETIYQYLRRTAKR